MAIQPSFKSASFVIQKTLMCSSVQLPELSLSAVRPSALCWSSLKPSILHCIQQLTLSPHQIYNSCNSSALYLAGCLSLSVFKLARPSFTDCFLLCSSLSFCLCVCAQTWRQLWLTPLLWHNASMSVEWIQSSPWFIQPDWQVCNLKGGWEHVTVFSSWHLSGTHHLKPFNTCIQPGFIIKKLWGSLMFYYHVFLFSHWLFFRNELFLLTVLTCTIETCVIQLSMGLQSLCRHIRYVQATAINV